jgi:phage baseplate assembly protein W
LQVVLRRTAQSGHAIDLRLREVPRSRDRIRRGDPDPTPARELVDLGVRAGRDNLAQALILRLLTPRGALAALGHAEYGSRLEDLVGTRKDNAARARCRAWALQALLQEPRVERVLEFRFVPERETLSSLVFEAIVQPHGEAPPVSVGLEVGL